MLSLGKPGPLDALVRTKGFTAVSATRVSAPFRLPSVADYLAFVRSSASPIMHILGGLDPVAQDAAWEDIGGKLSAFQSPTGWIGPNELLLVRGTRPAIA